MQKRNKTGFTLIELLVVIAIIMLLAGMLFRVGNIVSDRSNRARALADLQAMANALEEYFAHYGMYPPTSGMRYEYPETGLQPPAMEGTPAQNLSWGLSSYLFARGQDDPRRDSASEQVKEGWQHYLAELSLRRGAIHREMSPGEGTLVYSNLMLNIINPWGSAYQYESHVPYLSYRLWTSPPDSDEELSVSSSGL